MIDFKSNIDQLEKSCINKSIIDNKSLGFSNNKTKNMGSKKLKNKLKLKDDFCATEKLKNPLNILNDSVASNKSHLSSHNEMVNIELNETFTNGCLNLDFSEGMDDDISMTCDFVED